MIQDDAILFACFSFHRQKNVLEMHEIRLLEVPCNVRGKAFAT